MNTCGDHLQNHRGRPVGEGQLLLRLTQLPTVPMLGTIEVNSKYPKYFGKKFFKSFFSVFHRTSSQDGETTGVSSPFQINTFIHFSESEQNRRCVEPS